MEIYFNMLVINGKYKLGFVHIPKTSGTSLKNWFKRILAERNDATCTQVGYHSTLPEMQLPQDYRSVAVIRNPWDRMVSFYEFTKFCEERNFGEQGGAKLIGEPTKNMEFNEWMKYAHLYRYLYSVKKNEVNERFPFWFTPITPQTIWLPQDPDILIRFENLREGYMKLHEIMETNIPIPHIFKTDKQGAYQDYYNDHSRELVAKYFALDIERWGYTF